VIGKYDEGELSMEINDEHGHVHCNRCYRVINQGEKTVNIMITMDTVNDSGYAYSELDNRMVTQLCISCASLLLKKAVTDNEEFLATKLNNHYQNN
jgi:hypothetical protein